MIQLLRSWCRSKAWRRVAAVAAAALSLSTAQAQVDTYTFAASQGTYTALSGGTVLPLMAADTYLSPAIPLGFSFVFDGTTYTEVKAASDGYLTFNPAASFSSLTNALATGSASNRPLVAPLWDDLDGRPTGATGQASYLTTGTAPNRVFTFEWLNWEWRWNATGPVISFQVKLYEGSNRVEFVYRPESAPTTATSTSGASIGLSGVGTGPGSFLSLSDAVAAPTTSSTTENVNIFVKPASGQVYAFSPAPVTGCPAPRNLAFTNLTSTGVTLTWSGSGTGTYTVEYGPAGFTPGLTPSAGVVRTGLTTPSLSLTGLTPNTGYQFYVTQNCGGTAGNSTRTGPASFRTNLPPPSNEDCATAQVLPVTTGSTCTRTVFNLTGATASTGAPAPSCASYLGGDVWFRVTVPANGALIFETDSVAGASTIDTGMEIYSGTCTSLTAIECDDDDGNDNYSLIDRTGLTPGSTVFIRVWVYSNSTPSGVAKICVRSVTPPGACAMPTALTANNITATSATLTWAGSLAAGETYTVVYGPRNFTPAQATRISNLTSATTTLTNLQPNTEYCFYAEKVCGQIGTSLASPQTCFRTLLTIPANDDPCGAVALTVNSNGLVSGATSTTSGATTTTVGGISGLLPACTPALAPRDVWFRATLPTGTTSLDLNMSGSAAGMLRLFTASNCSTAFNMVACRASSGANTGVGRQQFTGLTAGQTYFIAVSGYSSGDTQGAFTIGTITSTRNQLAGGELGVFPNPVQDGELTVRLRGVGSASVAEAQLLNALGQVVRRAQLNVRNGAADQQIDTHQLSHGVYTLRVLIGGETLMRKVVVQ